VSGIRVTHIPVVFEPVEGKHGKIIGHVSKANPQHETFTGTHDAVIVFHGPHSYISPNWYKSPGPAVPTWNFAAVPRQREAQIVTDDVQSPSCWSISWQSSSRIRDRLGSRQAAGVV
jgi:transcriptional regulator